jgi:hypothetical protein
MISQELWTVKETADYFHYSEKPSFVISKTKNSLTVSLLSASDSYPRVYAQSVFIWIKGIIQKF